MEGLRGSRELQSPLGGKEALLRVWGLTGECAGCRWKKARRFMWASKGCEEEGLVKDLRVFTVECEEVVVGEPTHFH